MIGSKLAAFELFERVFSNHARIFRKNLDTVHAEFGDAWAEDLGSHLEGLFGLDPVAYQQAIAGYTAFSLDAMRLHARFNQTKRYENRSYDNACEDVYHNERFMDDVYLPGILISQFVWRHHYRQIQFYRSKFLPLLAQNRDKRFYEVGTGTGFYTIQALRHDPCARAFAIDISAHARRFTERQAVAWGVDSRITTMDVDIVKTELEPFPAVQSIEVLEHLSDPQLFLTHLRKMLQPGGHGFIAAAITAPETDHIYLYWTPQDVIQQLNAAGFEVLDFTEEPGYTGQPGEIVPKVAAFIVR